MSSSFSNAKANKSATVAGSIAAHKAAWAAGVRRRAAAPGDTRWTDLYGRMWEKANGRWVMLPPEPRAPAPPVAKLEEKLPPMKCQCCDYVNDYVGHEHLVDGLYYCRNHIQKVKAQKAEVEAKLAAARAKPGDLVAPPVIEKNPFEWKGFY